MNRSNNFLASWQILEKLDKLLNIWNEWEEHEEFYFQELLPKLMKGDNNALKEERNLITKIKRLASPEEWNNLCWVAQNLEQQKMRWWGFSNQLDRFLQKKEFNNAKQLATNFGNSQLEAVYVKRKNQVIEHSFSRIADLLESSKYEKSRRELKEIETCLSQKKFKEWKRKIQQREILDHINQVEQEIEKLLISPSNKSKYHQAHELLNEIQPYLEEKIYKEWQQKIIAKQKSDYICRANQNIDKALLGFKFNYAEQLHQELQQRYPDVSTSGYVKKVRQAHKLKLIKDIEALLEKNKFEKARQLYESDGNLLASSEYIELYRPYRQKYEKEIVEGSLKRYQFLQADQIFKKTEFLNRNVYEKLKAQYILQFAQENFPETPNQEQAEALADTSHNLLVQARAGSGKTRVIAQKTALLLHDSIENPDEIMILAFNRDAAREIRERIRFKYGLASFQNARTFHSLASRLVGSGDEGLLYDVKGKGVSRKKLSLFVQEILTDKLNPTFQERLYTFFRREIEEFEDEGLTLAKRDYYAFRRNRRQATLKGEYVKSKGEKWIADFLFEHGIDYWYEKPETWGEEHYYPDFYFNNHGIHYILEHWALDEHNQIPAYWEKSTEEYKEEIKEKRRFCKHKEYKLIETSVADMRLGRKIFEQTLKTRLQKTGVSCKKLPQEELYEKVKRDHLSRFARLVTQFIQKAKQRNLSPQDLEKKNYNPELPKERTFFLFARRAYELYEEKKRQENKIDYDDLLKKAIKIIHDNQGDCSIRIDRQRKISMNSLRWIMIDEYQDFSPLFFDLIQAIRQYNSQVRLFCVGDNWQAINAYAGSSLAYFEGFENYFNHSRTIHLLTNHRSKKKIVDNSNLLMKGLGRPSVASSNGSGGDVQLDNIDDVWIELRKSEQKTYQEDERFRLPAKQRHILTSKYLKRCHQIISEEDNIGKSTAILCRTNYIYSLELREFKDKLISTFSVEERKLIGDPRDKISVSTVHGYKGLESEIVILIRVCEGAYPLIHPDSTLFSVFGRTKSDVWDEEKRLFYVAFTRAKDTIYLLTEKGRESSFLQNLPVYDHYKDKLLRF